MGKENNDLGHGIIIGFIYGIAIGIVNVSQTGVGIILAIILFVVACFYHIKILNRGSHN